MPSNRSTNIENRNPKQIQRDEIQMTETLSPQRRDLFGIWDSCHSYLFRISGFDIRVSLVLTLVLCFLISGRAHGVRPTGGGGLRGVKRLATLASPRPGGTAKLVWLCSSEGRTAQDPQPNKFGRATHSARIELIMCIIPKLRLRLPPESSRLLCPAVCTDTYRRFRRVWG
jgi:hypothetical protein